MQLRVSAVTVARRTRPRTKRTDSVQAALADASAFPSGDASIVTARAVLIGPLPVAANLALPLTLTIDPMSAETRAAVEVLADRVGLPSSRLDAKASTLTPAELVRVHLARALAPGPQLVLLEHPTAAVRDEGERRSLGEALRHATEGTATGWLALTGDRIFGRAAGATWLRIGANGDVRREGLWSALSNRFR